MDTPIEQSASDSAAGAAASPEVDKVARKKVGDVCIILGRFACLALLSVYVF